jgi:myo-inositol-1-phosphate synthase
VVVNLASVERPIINSKSMETLEDFENALDENDESLTSGMIYAYAAISQKCGYVNFTPAVTADVPALEQLAKRNGVVLAGKDGKTGQTLYKTVLASMFQKRGLKVEGWYSTNILGNRDGEILNDQEHVKSKISTKQGVLPSILKYDDFVHQVHIHYYPPRGDLKEAWDNIDFTGWFGVKMQMKVNWLGCDSILAAPLVVDLVRWVHFLQGLGMSGNVKELGSYFKAPVGLEENDFFDQWLLLRSLN